MPPPPGEPECPDPEIQVFMDRSLPYRPRVEALMAATQRAAEGLIALVRGQLASERDPFVLATMVSSVGKLGDASDHLRLRMLLDHDDDRVVANTLDAMMKLGIPLERISALELISRRDARVAGNALVRLGQADLSSALDFVRKHYRVADLDHRKSFAHALTRLHREARVTQILVDILDWEDRGPLLRTIAEVLEKHLTELSGAERDQLLPRIVEQRRRAKGAKYSLLDQIVYTFAPHLR